MVYRKFSKRWETPIVNNESSVYTILSKYKDNPVGNLKYEYYLEKCK